MAQDCLGSLRKLVHSLWLCGNLSARLLEKKVSQERTAETAVSAADSVQAILERETEKRAEVALHLFLSFVQAFGVAFQKNRQRSEARLRRTLPVAASLPRPDLLRAMRAKAHEVLQADFRKDLRRKLTP